MCVCRLNFDNSAYRYIMKEDEEEQEILPITSDFFFEVFPFNIVFRQVMSYSARTLQEQLIDQGFVWNVCPSSLPLFILGHGGAQCRLRSGHSLPRSGWQEDQRCLLAGPPPCGVHLEHGKAPMTHPRTSAIRQRPLRPCHWLCAQIISHPNNLFEIMSKEPVKRERNLHNRVQSKSGSRHANTRRGVFPAIEDLLAWCHKRFWYS